MDVSRSRFPLELVNIIREIADSHFVAFDLEFSGIAGRTFRSGGRSLQQTYEEIRDAANMYQVLQFGMTIVTEDRERGAYFLKPYNFFIDPVPAHHNLKLERIWSFQSGAVGFLNRHNFDFGKPYKEGIPYLSRQEANHIRYRAPEVFEDLPLKTEDAALLDAVRKTITEWLAEAKDTRDHFLTLPYRETSGAFQAGFPSSFSRYQMRLIYQIVRNEFGTKVVAVGKRDWMQIIDYDQEREDNYQMTQIAIREKDISTSTEFRWLIEALAGGDFSQLDRYRFDPSKHGLSELEADSTAWQSLLEDLNFKIKRKRRVLVGHNLFTDLANLYKCFIGDLPASVDEFQRRIHELFPLIIDTKFMAKEPKERFEYSPLEELEWRLRGQTEPQIEIPAKFGNYEEEGNAHEAGYDSLMTAKVAIKLATRSVYKAAFEAQGLPKEVAAPTQITADDSTGDEGYSTAPESVQDGDSVVKTVKSSITSAISAPVMTVKSLLGSKTSKSEPTLPYGTDATTSEAVSGKAFHRDETLTTTTKRKPINWTDQSAVEALRKVFNQSTISGAVSDQGVSDPSSLGSPLKNRQDDVTSAQISRRDTSGGDTVRSMPGQLINLSDPMDGDDDGGNDEVRCDQVKEPAIFMPPWDDSEGFWDRNGNKLRVNACREGYCQLGQ